MPYVYRYIDLNKEEVVYIGKVIGYKDFAYDPLKNRHEQHQREQWYKQSGMVNILMQYIELDSHVDADIYESWLISYYDTGQLFNKAKTKWGKSKIDLGILDPNAWTTYDDYGFTSIESAMNESRRLCRWIEDSTKDLSWFVKKDADAAKCLYGVFHREIAKPTNYILREQRLSLVLYETTDFLRREESIDDYEGIAEHETA